MKRLSLIAVITLGFALPTHADDADDDHAKIQGTWLVVSAADDGKPAPEDQVKKTKIVITKDKLILKVITERGEQSAELSYKLDAGKKPKWIDLTIPNRRMQVMPGIYALAGDELKICFNETSAGNRGRPTKFVSEMDSANDTLMILKREKP